MSSLSLLSRRSGQKTDEFEGLPDVSRCSCTRLRSLDGKPVHSRRLTLDKFAGTAIYLVVLSCNDFHDVCGRCDGCVQATFSFHSSATLHKSICTVEKSRVGAIIAGLAHACVDIDSRRKQIYRPQDTFVCPRAMGRGHICRVLWDLNHGRCL